MEQEKEQKKEQEHEQEPSDAIRHSSNSPTMGLTLPVSLSVNKIIRE